MVALAKKLANLFNKTERGIIQRRDKLQIFGANKHAYEMQSCGEDLVVWVFGRIKGKNGIPDQKKNNP